MLGTFSTVYQPAKYSRPALPSTSLSRKLPRYAGCLRTNEVGRKSTERLPRRSGAAAALRPALRANGGRRQTCLLPPNAGQLPGRAEPCRAAGTEHLRPRAARRGTGQQRSPPARRWPGAPRTRCRSESGRRGLRSATLAPRGRPTPEPCRAPSPGLNLCRARRGTPTAGGGGQPQLAGPRLPGVKGVGGR